VRRQRLYGAWAEADFDPMWRRDRTRAPLRQAQWSAYYHRFFGRVRPGDQVPAAYAPLSLDDATAALHDALRAPLAVPAHEPIRHDIVRRCAASILIYGHRPSAGRKDDFERVMTIAATPEVGARAGKTRQPTAERAKDFLIRWGTAAFLPIDPEQEMDLRIPERLKETPNDKHLVALPTTITNTQSGFAFDKRVYMRTTIAAVRHLINPENWSHLGLFFALTRREDEKPDQRGKAIPWHGVLDEHFIVSWNEVQTSVFKQRLKVDYSVTRDLVRTDYALMYEEDDQVVVNDGFMQISRERDLPPGWIAGRMQKKLKFTSSLQNLFCPALLSMLVDGTVGGFNNFVRPRGAAAGAIGLLGGPIGEQINRTQP
jgi:hypothetical protein